MSNMHRTAMCCISAVLMYNVFVYIILLSTPPNRFFYLVYSIWGMSISERERENERGKGGGAGAASVLFLSSNNNCLRVFLLIDFCSKKKSIRPEVCNVARSADNRERCESSRKFAENARADLSNSFRYFSNGSLHASSNFARS